VDLFWKHVKTEGKCLVWFGAKVDGYGKLRRGSEYYLAHRYHWESVKGPVPEGLELDHLCRNRACVNLEHLEPVTGQVNTIRGVGPTAVNFWKTECIHGHAFTEENVWVSPSSGRWKCRTCMKREADTRQARTKGPGRPKPDKETLAAELKEYTAVALGEWYGVTDNTIRNWAKKWGLKPPTRKDWHKLKKTVG